MSTRTADDARAELRQAGISITQWALSHKFSPNLVFEVLGGRKKCVRGQSHEIAIKLGLKEGAITNPLDIDHSKPSAELDRRSHARRHSNA